MQTNKPTNKQTNQQTNKQTKQQQNKTNKKQNQKTICIGTLLYNMTNIYGRQALLYLFYFHAVLLIILKKNTVS